MRCRKKFRRYLVTFYKNDLIQLFYTDRLFFLFHNKNIPYVAGSEIFDDPLNLISIVCQKLK